MEPIRRQIRRARRRLILQQFFASLGWAILAALCVAAIAIGISKYHPLGLDRWTWDGSWLGGSLAAAVVVSAIWATLQFRAELDAAVEIDRRFALKERISSSLLLDEAERETAVGRALVDDAQARIERISMADEFRVRPSRSAWAPVLPALLVAALAMLPAAVAEEPKQSPAVIAKQTKETTKKLELKIAARKKEAEKKQLAEASKLFEKIESGLKRASSESPKDRKQAVAKLNNLAEQLKRRQDELKKGEQLRRQLGKLDDLSKGPAEKLAAAMKKGDAAEAKKQVDDLLAKMADGKLSEAERKALADQLGKMGRQLADAAQKEKQARDDLEKKIDELRKSGNVDQAQQLQNQLDKMNRNRQSNEALEKMAQQLGQCAECMRQGDSEQASQQMQELAQQFSQMEKELTESEMLDEAMKQFTQAKQQMLCPECNGEGCSACQGGQKVAQGGAGGKGKGGDGLGEAQGGEGDRPIKEDDTATFDTRAPSNFRPGGQSVVIGEAGGTNVAGPIRQSIQDALESGDAEDADSLGGRRLPREEQQQAKEYFDRLRGATP